ncbi:MAG: hypothetical protein EZS28_027231 [Streblomastix strix]|uniref:RNase H type-1 domain-containing protein n=1 Tax=Streblomastix strix TaxID=222440 RepID=A0A5J4V421_9EUKA|nr:MAG: hypothetical protein EZS28_027231 [Streblomastix strix]
MREKLRNIIFQKLKDGVIRVIKSGEVRFLSPVHVVPKNGRKQRKILDYQVVDYLEGFRYKPRSASSIPSHQGEYRASTLSGVNIREDRIHFPENAFLVATAPQIFAQTLKTAIIVVRRRWKSRILANANYIPLLNLDMQMLRHEKLKINNFLISLEQLIAEDKSQMEPSQEFEFLGWLWRTKEMTFQLTVDRRRCMLKELRLMMNKVKNREKIPVRKLASLIGGIRFIEAQWKRGPLHTKQLDHLKSKTANQSGWNSLVQLIPQLMKDLSWWFNKVKINNPYCFLYPTRWATIQTDTSKDGWGATLKTQQFEKIIVWGRWKTAKPTSSNQRELLAILLTMK